MERPQGLEPQYFSFVLKSPIGIPVLGIDGNFPDTVVQDVDDADAQSDASHLSRDSSDPDAAGDSGDSSDPDAAAPARRGARDVPVKMEVPGGAISY